MHTRKVLKSVAAASAVLLLSTACLEEGGGDSGGGSGNTGNGDTTVEIVFGFGGDQSKAFQASLGQWASQNGVTIKYTEASQSFDTLIRSRVAGNNLPDIAFFPQPGVMMDIAKTGKLQDLSTIVDVNALKSTLVPGELDAGTSADGKIYGTPMSMNVKSLVWYPKKAFEAKGWKEPTTTEELIALTNTIKASGTAPWCVGIEAGPATGWPVTDWIEDYVLRIGGPEKYDQWVKHEIPFNDPVVKQAAQTFEQLTLTEGNTFGGRSSMISNAFSTAANPMFDNPPKCFLHRQGNFITQKGFFPDRIRESLDSEVGVFLLPGTTAADKPVLGGGDLAAAFSNDDATKKVMSFVTSPQFNGGTKEGSYISPHKTFDASQYPDETTRKVAQLAYQATVFRFDGSDQMPGAVGAGSFWKDSVAWIGGQKDVDKALNDIESSWPK
ncbi:ABC transporter substrate-binding protein [Spirilliplanes yamanashiensis]|uniref:Sugar ABC transporter substrate-binding protein n=1 Tax=Spirilliplanes yamanashiensis TaxID=42233 RepID=A0A8J3YBG7_9ACTN|nr:ABC transporter substrate-binding protein [Spirilliplanes yamanashiensis]MDP9818013.1 alpha-glucoside transport system substrate-binding protein [Spirilliplanes yamanashiensis]GIJ04822.1 sugar ABC transporter substrate-binding protein [Spirilliplanes yamanashiensis]